MSYTYTGEKGHYTVAVLHWTDGRHLKIRAYNLPLWAVLQMMVNTTKFAPNRYEGEGSKLIRRGFDFTVGMIEVFETAAEAQKYFSRVKCKDVCAVCEVTE